MRVCEQAVRVVDAERADLFLRSRDGGLRLEATYGRPGDAIGAAAEGIVAAVVERGAAVSGERSLAVPLSWDGQLRGALVVEFASEHADDGVLDLLTKLAELAAGACRNAMEHAALALEARTDGLTGCLNHAAMQDTLRRELERCRRTGHGLSLAIVDLDDFKQVNEQHGHQAGDEVLKHVGSALRDSVRAYDVVARYGGDEFAIIALDAGEDVTADVVARGLGRDPGQARQPGLREQGDGGDRGRRRVARGRLADDAHRAGRPGAPLRQARGAARDPDSRVVGPGLVRFGPQAARLGGR